MTDDAPRPPPIPCGSCPYRMDVPPGVWADEEYDKLPAYDGSTTEQLLKGATALFMCHQHDGHLCGGWLACHDTRHLLALRLHAVDPTAYMYETDVAVFSSGEEAREHGQQPKDDKAEKMINGLLRKRDARKVKEVR